MIRFKFNPEKAVQVVLWILGKKDGISKHTLSKVLFFADKYHLNTYGRPVVGGQHIAMQYGPVPSEIYDMLKDPYCEYSDVLGLDKLPFYTHEKYVHADEGIKINIDLLSESDIEALDSAYNKCVNLSFRDLTELSHDEKGWIKAWEVCQNSAIEYVDLIDEVEDKAEKVEWFEFASNRLRM